VPMNMNALPSPLFRNSNRVPGPCLTIAQIIQPCVGAAWRLNRMTLSITTMGAISGVLLASEYEMSFE
jgi:hypothetical protein